MFDTDSLILAATASLYALEHRDIVRENFSRLFQMLVSSFEDETFIERLHKLGAPSCEKIVCEKLSEHVYDTCFASIEAMFSDGPKV